MRDFLKQRLREEISAREAYSDQGAIETILNGKRNIGTFAQANQRDLDRLTELGLEYIKVPSNPHNLYIMFNPKAKDQAMELLNIAEKYEGYLAWFAEENDTRRIGKLLGYADSDVEEFVQRMNIKKKESGFA
jgi:hypothetical protein